MTVTIWHNPRCSKSRETLALLRERGLAPRIVEYLADPPTRTELDRVLKLLGREPRDAMRKGESEYKALKLDDAKLSRQQLIAAMVAHPILIERPIVLSGTKAALGRPPEAVLEIL
ncbi:MAG TPA: arsenate reductase (glutaredoxin) [Candidatus Cybelea sp.]|nr:arsenate reductase (glutaredoxin) [Candidatus Cybelea sp.]